MHNLDRETLNAGWSVLHRYQEDILVLMARDPRWLFAYWEVTGEKARRVNTLRVYRYAWGRDEEVENYYDEHPSPEADNWYLEAGVADRFYHVELGWKTPEGFHPVLRSNKVRTPRESISEIIDENWCLPDWQSRRLFRRISLSHLSSAELLRSRRPLRQRLKNQQAKKESYHA